MTDTLKDKLIVSQSAKIFNLEMSLAKDKLIVKQSLHIMSIEELLASCQDATRTAVREQIKYKEILHSISELLKYDGDYTHLLSVIRNRVAL